MPNINMNDYNNAIENSGSTFSQMLPGAYVVRVQAVRTEGDTRSGHWTADEKQYVQIVWDVAEGEFAGKYSADYFTDAMGRIDPSKDYMHVMFLSWKNLGYCKKILRCFTESNPGFDAEAAFFADRWEMFIGKCVGVVLDGTVDTNDRGYDRWKLNVGDVVTIGDARTGNHREPKITDERTKLDAVSTVDDVPFI